MGQDLACGQEGDMLGLQTLLVYMPSCPLLVILGKPGLLVPVLSQ